MGNRYDIIKPDADKPAEVAQDVARTVQENNNSSSGAILFFAIIILVFIISGSLLIKSIVDYSGTERTDNEEVADAVAPIVGTWIEADPEPEGQGRREGSLYGRADQLLHRRDARLPQYAVCAEDRDGV